jgi:hypothetical protein
MSDADKSSRATIWTAAASSRALTKLDMSAPPPTKKVALARVVAVQQNRDKDLEAFSSRVAPETPRKRAK